MATHRRAPATRGSGKGNFLDWSMGGPWQVNQDVAKKLGVMFLGTKSGSFPWDFTMTVSRIVDGTSNTILLAENTLAGATGANAFSGSMPTNWACPLPNFCMFFGSDEVCDGAGCSGGQLQPIAGTTDGAGWANANNSSTYTSINFCQPAGVTVKGSFIYPSSFHPGGLNVGCCDGSVKFITTKIDAVLYSKLLTPAGTKLPIYCKQLTTGDTLN